MVIITERGQQRTPIINLGNKEIQRVDKYKYLGTIINAE